MAKIAFGTDGWRGEIARDFTFANVSRVTEAFVKYIKNSGLANAGVAVGYDNRFQSEDFALLAASICAQSGIKTFYSKISLPSPALSYVVNSRKLGSGIMITASHNPGSWNGFKIKEAFGINFRNESPDFNFQQKNSNFQCQSRNGSGHKSHSQRGRSP